MQFGGIFRENHAKFYSTKKIILSKS